MIDQDKDTNYLEHLSVLRKSIIKFLIFLGITFVVAAFFSKDIFNFIYQVKLGKKSSISN